MGEVFGIKFLVKGLTLRLVLLHGGPGYSSFYLKPLEELGNDRQVIRYDQLGAGKSEVVNDHKFVHY